ncbi:hypothetical protein NHX12_031796 [Muraenolepis orangiensis]|uniref:Uncharacterized protein n=1 Tax=Muraenolepis orangiensis TaxID=630683 RepID=A0A9Q0IKZ4_9TELE|nr:hypothetical protein NHX12_031796 [Muraenolepis orangiensis]
MIVTVGARDPRRPVAESGREMLPGGRNTREALREEIRGCTKLISWEKESHVAFVAGSDEKDDWRLDFHNRTGEIAEKRDGEIEPRRGRVESIERSWMGGGSLESLENL